MIRRYRFPHGIKLWNLGDIHRGNAQCATKFWQDTVAKIAGDSSSYWVSTGDMLEVAIKHSVGDVHGAMGTMQELDLVSEELLPIKDKCLGFVGSNHHRRVDKHTGLSLDRMIASHCGLPYLGETGIINLVIGKGAYFIVLHHGSGGGTEGNAVNRALNAANNYRGADLYLSGHTHRYSAIPFSQQIIDRKRGIIRNVLSYSVVTGHCLEWKGSYAESMSLKPAPIGFSVCDIGPNPSGREGDKKITPKFYTG